jgi:hypothetical protein
MMKHWGVLAAVVVAVGASAAQAAPVTIDFGGTGDSGSQPAFRSFMVDGDLEAGSAQVAVDGVASEFVQIAPGAVAAEASALPSSFELGAGFDQPFVGTYAGTTSQSRTAAARGSVGATSTGAAKGNFFDASTTIDGGFGAGIIAAAGTLDGAGFGGLSIGTQQISTVPLPQSATMGLGLLAAVGAYGVWRRRRRTSEIA